MEPQFEDKQFFQEGFRLMASCPMCQTKYQPNLAKVLAEKDDAYLLHVPCPKCHTAVVALIFANMFGVNSVGLLTDLQSDEVLAREQQPLTADDVLDVYVKLKEGSLVGV